MKAKADFMATYSEKFIQNSNFEKTTLSFIFQLPNELVWRRQLS